LKEPVLPQLFDLLLITDLEGILGAITTAQTIEGIIFVKKKIEWDRWKQNLTGKGKSNKFRIGIPWCQHHKPSSPAPWSKNHNYHIP